MIIKREEGYYVLSEKTGRNLGGPASRRRSLGGPYKTLEEAKRRLRQVEFFKYLKKKSP